MRAGMGIMARLPGYLTPLTDLEIQAERPPLREALLLLRLRTVFPANQRQLLGLSGFGWPTK